MRKRDYYGVLGVPRSAGVAEIRRAYRRLARQYSPDVNVWDARAGDLFAEIAEAFRVLGDAATRAQYDRAGHQTRAAGGAGSLPRGEDLHYPVEIEFEHAYRGGEVTVDTVRLSPCPACAATGGESGQPAESCHTCRGRPVRLMVDGERAASWRCPACRATGWQLAAPCPACGGRGTVPETVRLPVTIPPGVDTGAQLRIPGEGHATPAPGLRGDVVVITRVRPHPVFTRKGDQVCCEVPVTVPEAALGARIAVPTPEGAVMVTVPAGTQPGQVFRVRGRGFPRLDRDGRGDLLVTARVLVPRHADPTLEEVLRALARLWPGDPRAELWGRVPTIPGGVPA